MKKFMKQAKMGKAFWQEYKGAEAMEYYRQGQGSLKQTKRWCKTHITGRVGQKWDGSWYTKCSIGHKKNEVCDIRIS